MATAGYQVTGVDVSPRSIEYAKQVAIEKRLDIDYLNADYLTLQLHKQFDLILLIYCDFGALVKSEREVLLKIFAEHLAKDGKIVFDVFSLESFNQVEEQSWAIINERGFWTPEPYLELKQTFNYQENISLEQYLILSKYQLKRYHIWNTFFDEKLLAAELQPAFHITEIYGDVAGTPLTKESATLAFVIERS